MFSDSDNSSSSAAVFILRFHYVSIGFFYWTPFLSFFFRLLYVSTWFLSLLSCLIFLQPWIFCVTFHLVLVLVFWKEKKLYGFFLCMGFNCLKVTEPLWRDSLLFIIHPPGVSATQLIYLERIKSCVDLGATQWFWIWDPWIANPAP